jgi:polar amino acid transport system substrate-binding protein
MKEKLLKITLVLTLTLMTIILSSCSKEEIKTEDTFSSIKERGYVIVGLDDTFVPMGFKDNKGKLVGFDIDLAKEVFKRIGIEVRFQPIDWSMKEAELNSKNIDLIWNGYTITNERKEKVAFTKPYLENRQVIITLSSSPISSKKDLKGKSVAVQNGSSSLDALNKEEDLVKEFEGGGPVLFDTNNEALMDLEAGRVDAVVADEILARYYMNERGVGKYNVLSDDFGKEEYGIGFRKQDKKLLELVEKTLDDMKKDGTCKKISEKWFGVDIVK